MISPKRFLHTAGFTILELMVTIAIIAMMMVLAMPSFGTAGRSARERGLVAHLIQDFTWARGAAGASSAHAIDSTLTSTTSPTVSITLNGDCSWSTSINGTVNVAHSLTLASLNTLAPGMSCSSTPTALPVTFTFKPQGFVDNTGTVTRTGATSTTNQLRILYSGSIIRLNGGQS
jgi:type IV fimbrial biogenesis protein FimT